jgi:hypothetical protein
MSYSRIGIYEPPVYGSIQLILTNAPLFAVFGTSIVSGTFKVLTETLGENSADQPWMFSAR